MNLKACKKSFRTAALYIIRRDSRKLTVKRCGNARHRVACRNFSVPCQINLSGESLPAVICAERGVTCVHEDGKISSNPAPCTYSALKIGRLRQKRNK